MEVFVSTDPRCSFDKNLVKTLAPRTRVKQTDNVPTFSRFRRSLGTAAIVTLDGSGNWVQLLWGGGGVGFKITRAAQDYRARGR